MGVVRESESEKLLPQSLNMQGQGNVKFTISPNCKSYEVNLIPQLIPYNINNVTHVHNIIYIEEYSF